MTSFLVDLALEDPRGSTCQFSLGINLTHGMFGLGFVAHDVATIKSERRVQDANPRPQTWKRGPKFDMLS